MSQPESLEDLLGLYQNHEKSGEGNFTLDTFRRVVELHPEISFSQKAIHIAGTNGKGTVAWSVESILRQCGLKTGLYTSPHLRLVSERIRLDGVPVDDTLLFDVTVELHTFLNNREVPRITWFEFMTLAAMVIFSRQGMDVVILETGLGGRLDATNLFTPVVAGITSISLDHTQILGNTLEDIAREKAGILKDGVPLVIYDNGDAVNSVVLSEALNKKATVFHENRDYGFREWHGEIEFYQDSKVIFRMDEVQPFPLHRYRNIAQALMLASVFLDNEFPLIHKQKIAGWMPSLPPGRLEIMSNDPMILFDVAHNVEAIRELYAWISRAYNGRRISTLLHLMKDKETSDILSICSAHSDTIYLIQSEDERAWISDTHPVLETPEAIVEMILSSDNSAIFLFTGSFRHYTVACDTVSLLAKRRK